MEWVEVRGKSVEVAVEAALRELGVENRDQVDVEVLQEPEKGFLGLGGRDAIVRVKPRSDRKRRRRRRRGKGGAEQEDRPRQEEGRRSAGQQGKTGRNGGREQSREQSRGSSKAPAAAKSGRPDKEKPKATERRPQPARESGSSGRERLKKETPTMTIEEQVPVVEEFLTGLVDAFGLEGEVTVEVDSEVIVADVRGPQTEAMVGPRGRVIEAVHELTKTVLQRQTQQSARLRLDIAGYGERRRQALSIYAGQLIDQVLAEGGEVVLEPMSAGDRKVIHDAVGARNGVESFSEGEAPRRYVVIAATASAPSGDEEE